MTDKQAIIYHFIKWYFSDENKSYTHNQLDGKTLYDELGGGSIFVDHNYKENIKVVLDELHSLGHIKVIHDPTCIARGGIKYSEITLVTKQND